MEFTFTVQKITHHYQHCHYYCLEIYRKELMWEVYKKYLPQRLYKSLQTPGKLEKIQVNKPKIIT